MSEDAATAPGAAGAFRPWASFGDRQRWWFLAVLFLIATASYADRSFLPVVLEQIRIEFGLSDRMLGLLGGAPFALCYGLSTIPFGRVADSGRRKLWLILAFALWTAMTMLCGFAMSLPVLFVARMGVGIGEGGAVPVSHALVADYFPPRTRGKAFAVLTAATTLGSTVALIGGGWLTHKFGWRPAFVVMGVASLPIGLLAMAVLREPPRHAARRASFVEDLAALTAKRSFLFVTAGFTVYTLFGYGPIVFMTAYLVRIMGLDIAVAGQVWGIPSAVGTVLGSVVGGIICDRLTRRDARWLVWWPAIGLLVGLPAAILTFAATTPTAYMIWATMLMTVLGSAVPAIFAVIQYVCGPSRRATATAVVMAAINAIGMSVGAFATGAISDLLAPSFHILSLRYACMAMSLVLVPAALLLALAGGRLRADAE